jgi:transglutaminase-like putative cysteine protease
VRRRSQSRLASELALWLVTAAAVIGMHRLFEDGSYRSTLLLQAVLAHTTVALLRRSGLGLLPSALATAGVGALALTWIHYPGTTTWLIPTGGTLEAAGDDLDAAWRLFQDVQAPAPVQTGFLLAAGVAVWLMVFVADWAAFRAAATFEALLPSATLFLFAAALGAEGGRVAGATVYTAAAMLFVLLQRTLNQEESSTWAASHRTRGRWSLLGTGATLISVAVIAGAITGPNLPGAGADAIIGWQDINEDDETRVVISPMVEIRRRLVDQPDIELFTVRSSEAAYWRLTALDEFDGEIWRSSYGTNDADGSLPQSVESRAETATVEQSFTISALAAVWLPAAYQPVSIDPGENDVDWDERSSTLIVDKALESSDGFTYTVESQVPRWTDDELRRAGTEVPQEIAGRYLDLPELNPAVGDLARDLTEAETNPYDKGLALMRHLRSDQFTYDLEAQGGHGSDALTSFLFDSKRGYCEQFAGSFAAMARTIGLPSRVVVGFSPGRQDPADPTLFHIRGEHTHAWAEIYLDGFGWVMLDPTPGRGPPGSDQWLGVPTQQDAGTGDGSATSPAPGQGSGLPSSLPAPSGDEQRTSIDPDRNDPDRVSNAGGDGAEVSNSVRTAALIVFLAMLAYVVLVPAALAVQRELRRRRAHTPAQRVRLAWRDAIERAGDAGIDLPSSLTLSETAERLTAALPGAAAAVRQLAGSMERVMYAEVMPSVGEAEQAVSARDVVADEARRRQPVGLRIARWFDARELWRHRPQRLRRTARTTPRAALGH